MDSSLFFDAAFWENAWQQAINLEKGKRGKKAVEAWNLRSKSYGENAATDSGSRRVADALAFLDSYCVPERDAKILDIGCGPGIFSLALAERGHTVFALDPAEKMLVLLEERLAARPELKERVRTVQADWVELELSQYGWEGHFDLVFASMTPGVCDAPTLRKAINASKGYVYLSRFAGPRMQPSAEAVWQKLQGHNYRSDALDIVFPLNWLYASGYRPVLHYSSWEREVSQPLDDAVAAITEVLALRMEIDGRVDDAVRAYVAKKANKGFFSEIRGATSAMLLWRVDKEVIKFLEVERGSYS